MPRRSSRAVPASAAAPAPAPKRRAPDTFSAEKTESKRPKCISNSTTADTKSVKTTAKKSKYFKQETCEIEASESKDGSEREGSVYESAHEDSQDASETPELKSPGAASTDHGAEKGQSSKQGKRGQQKAQGRDSSTKNDEDERSDVEDDAVTSLINKELWREGVKTGLGPGKEVFIKKPKARDAGDVPYQDHTMHPNTMLFLKDLAKNNEREWLKAHDPDFRAAKKDWESFVESLTENIIEQDSTIPELPAKDLIFRIHRDVRFSKNPTPYKTHFSAAWSRTGKKGPYAAYYVHMQPGSCFVGSGLWNPEANALAALREDIDQNSSRLMAVLKEPEMRREILNGIPDDEKEAVKVFVDHNKESALKVKPKGYDVDNENIQLLRLRSFTIGRPLSDSEFMNANVQERIAGLIGIMEPFVTYLNSVVMPDPVGEEPSSGSEEGEESLNENQSS
ncbi:DUF2461 domain-containing protein [Aspergillus chevalieri]|uniref:TIGR02453 family protein n=1 Tax=Aspergillus chevalieri TaxID=182096 RepID=A0A7R7ZQC4_ASPCH|nr:uncharacterized protein ACHE_50829A [Aspergillus chevalieri]BCR89631.1 hypothetical protein ACHE_50829A [Aspergillus chevalieri]